MSCRLALRRIKRPIARDKAAAPSLRHLINQLFWMAANKRGDRWGGPTLKDRAQFAAEILRAVRRSVGDLPVIIRIS